MSCRSLFFGLVAPAILVGCVIPPIAAKSPPETVQPSKSPDSILAEVPEQPGPKAGASFTVVQDPTATATWSPPLPELR